MTHTSRYFFELANILPDKRQPYVGEAAFSHKAGLHTDVVLKSGNLIEHVSSSAVGNYRQILLSELSGKSTVLAKMKKFGDFNKNSPEVQKVLKLLKSKEAAGYEYEAAEASFMLLIAKCLKKYKPFMELNNYHLESGLVCNLYYAPYSNSVRSTIVAPVWEQAGWTHHCITLLHSFVSRQETTT